MSDFPLLYARSVNGLFFTGNTVTRSDLFEPWHPNKFTFNIGYSKNVVIIGNKIGKRVLGRNILLEKMNKKELQTDADDLQLLLK
jgi:hypothetical protein